MFDIDKMYLMFPTYDFKNGKLKYENYNNDLTEPEQTKGSLQNRLIELYKSVLLNENVIGEVMTPVDFTHVKDDILHFVDKTPTTNLSTFNQLDDIDTKYDFLAGKAGVGQQANALMDYVLGSLGNLSITNFSVPKSNSKLDMEYSQKLSQVDLDYYAKELKLSFEEVDKLKSIKIGHSLSAILNAFVDIAKDPYITRGNWVTMTTNTGNLLLRKGVHPFYVNAFLAQPILKEYIEFSASYESSENQGLSTADAFIKERFGEEKYNKRNNSNIFSEDLKTLRSKEFLTKETSQMNVLATFLKYQSASKAIKTNIDASKFMVNGIGGSVNSLIIAKNAVDSILDAENRYSQLEDKSNFKDNIILGFRSKFTNPNGSESMFSKLYNNIIIKPEQIVKANPKLFLAGNNTIQNTFNEISKDSKNEILLDEDLGKDLDKTFYSYIMSGFDSLNISNQERRDLTLNFPKEFEVFKEANKDKYTIVDEITIKQSNTLEFIGLNNRKKSQDYEKLLVGSFLDLLNKDEEFANKLIKYSYLTSGFNNHTTQFFTMIPTQWFNRNNINRYILDKSVEYNTNYTDSNDNNFIDQYYLANLENKKLVKNVSQGQVLKGSGSIHGFVLDKPGKTSYFRVKSDPMGQNPDIYYKLIGYDKEYRGVYSRFIPNINDQLSEIKPLNVKDKKGNRIINYDTKGINLKPVTETSPGLANQIDKNTLSDLNDSAIYPRDIFYRENVIIKKESEIEVGQQEVTPEVSEINIYAGSNENSELSNFAIRPFTINVETPSGSKEFNFQSVEQGFHFYKAIVAENPTVGKKILETTNGGQLRSLTNRNNLPMTPSQAKEWDETSKSIMLNLMYDSYAQNPKEAQKLLNTGNATITHIQDNTRWKTDFPEVVMTVRDMLREEGFENNEVREVKPQQLSLIQPLNEGVDIKYPSEINGLDTLKLMELSNISNDEIIPFKKGESYTTTIENLYGEYAGTYVDVTDSELSKSEGEFFKNNPKFSELFLNEYLETLDGDTLQSYAKKLLDNSEKEYVNKNQLSLFEDTDWTKEDNDDTCVPF